jgi:hypothetical protein
MGLSFISGFIVDFFSFTIFSGAEVVKMVYNSNAYKRRCERFDK